MKALKIAGISVILLLVILYTSFLFILPNVINLNNYKKDIQKIVKDTVKLKIDADNIKLITTPSLHAGVKIEGLKITYPDGKEILSSKYADVKLKLLPLMFLTVQVDSATADTPSLSLTLIENGQVDIVDYITQNMPKTEAAQNSSEPLPIKFSNKLPKIVIENYAVLMQDKKTSNTIKIKGDRFIFDKAEINKQFRINTYGQILLNSKSNILYNINIDSFWPIQETVAATAETPDIPFFNPINELVKYDLKSDITTELKIRQKKDGDLKIHGFCNIDKLSAILDSQKLPDSFIHIIFKDNKINLNSDLNISENEKATISADIKNPKNLKINLNLKTKKITFKSLQKYLTAIANSLNVPNELNQLNTDGYITSDFTLDTDMKKFKSSGYFKIINGSITHKTLPVNIKSIDTDIDFSNNNVNIKKASALINGAILEAKGKIDEKSVADIKINSQTISLKSLYTVLAPVETKKAYDLQNGSVSLDIIIKGKLAEIQPQISVKLVNLLLKDKINNIIISNKETITDIKTKAKSFDGIININNAKVLLSDPKFAINLPTAKIQIGPKNIHIIPFNIFLENSAVNISGEIKNYISKPDINIIANGNLNAIDLKQLLPKEAKGMISANGKLPLIVTVSGDDKNIKLNAQIKADTQNNFTILTIKKLTNRPSVLSASLGYTNDTLSVDDFGLYALAKNLTLTQNTKKTLHGADKIASVTGSIENLSKAPYIRKLNINIPDPLILSSPALPNAAMTARGRLSINGNIMSPAITGFAKITGINLPDYLTKINSIDLNFNNNLIDADIQELNLNGSVINITAEAPSKIDTIFVINKMTLTSPNLDAEKVLKIAEKMPQTTTTPPNQTGGKKKGPVFPIKIITGSGVIEKFSMGTIAAANISSDFNLYNDVLNLKNLKASAYTGNICGNVSYNLATLGMKAKINGKNIDANSAITAFMGLKDQLKGTLNFNANLSLKGATYEQQIKTLNGTVDFNVNDGQMGSLGRIETFLQAGNLVSQSFVRTQIGALLSVLAPYNTGKFEYLNGALKINNGTANITSIKSSGPHMSLFISGNMNILSSNGKLDILGTLSPQVAGALGPITNLSVDKIAAYIPKFGNTISSMMNKYNEQTNKSQLAKIPDLTPKKDNTKSFSVLINGNMMNPVTAVKSFKWLNTAEEMQNSQKSILELLKPKLPEGTETKPMTKEELKEEVKNKVEQLPQVQKIQQNETVKNLGAIYQFYKNSKENKQ